MNATVLSAELRHRLFSFLTKRVNNRDDAEDILQSVLLKVHNAPALDAPEAVHGWLFQVARNAVIDYYRSRRPTDDLPADLAAAPAADEPESAALLACMRQMVEALPQTYREALILSDLESVPQKEVAKRLGLGLSGTKSRIQRGREKLRDLVQTCCHIELDAYGNTLEHICRTPGCTCCH